MGIPEDLQSDGPIRFTHRRTDSVDIYFLANTTDKQVSAGCEFRVTQGMPQLWDPVTAGIRRLPQYTRQDKTTSVPLVFEPHQSFFVVFPRDDESQKRTVPGGVNFPEVVPVATLEGAWEVSFDPEWGGPEHVRLPGLQDWRQRDEEGIRHYAGIATYTKTFAYPALVRHSLGDGRSRIYLDLGRVHEIAGVTLNGKTLGVVWCAPWRIDITDALKEKDNHLEIRVANLWTNRLLGDAKKPVERRLTRTALRYRAGGALMPSGLLGPVTLRMVKGKTKE